MKRVEMLCVGFQHCCRPLRKTISAHISPTSKIRRVWLQSSWPTKANLRKRKVSTITHTWLPLQEMLSLVGCDMRDCGKDITTVSGSALDTVSVVNATLASLMVDIKVPEIIVKVNGSSAKITPKQGSMSGKDSGHIDVTLAAKSDTHTGKPFVEVGNDGCLIFMCNEL
jgi:hypothetical protein